MPYIKLADREDIDHAVRDPENAGELNYVLTLMCQEYFQQNGGRYQQINDIIGALEGCKLEFYRRLVAEYENEKILENGDVY
jgi:hypothetical protein